MKSRIKLAGLALATATACGPALADDVAIGGDGAWYAFSVDASLAPVATPLAWIDDEGSPVGFTFTIGAGLTGTLTVVDAAFAGDAFTLFNLGAFFGNTSAVPVGSLEASHDVGLDYAAALGDSSFSRGVFSLAAGSYRITGSLSQSATFEGVLLDATAGAVRLLVSPVPEPETYALMLAGLLVVGSLTRRRGRESNRKESA